MTRYLLDTDTCTHLLRHHPAVVLAVAAHLPTELVVSIITVEELWDGWQAVIRKAKTPPQVAAAYTRLTDTIHELKNWTVVPFPEPAVHQYADLKARKLNVGANDLRIAATGLEAGATVVTANVRDFRRVPGLQIEDWTSTGGA